MYKSPSTSRQASLFWDLETMLDPKHPLFILANMIDWASDFSMFDKLIIFAGEKKNYGKAISSFPFF